VFAGILPWTFFTGLSEASNSLINNSSLISRVYFPRLIVPIAAVVVAFVDFLISFCILLVLMVWYRYFPDWRISTLPIFVTLAFFASVGPALWITSLNVKYRDFRYVIQSSCSSASMSRPSVSVQSSFPSNGACRIRLIRWWA